MEDTYRRTLKLNKSYLSQVVLVPPGAVTVRGYRALGKPFLVLTTTDEIISQVDTAHAPQMPQNNDASQASLSNK